MKTLLHMFGLIKDQHRRLFLAILTNTLLGLAALIPPYTLKVVIDSLVKLSNHQIPNAQPIIWALAGLLGVQLFMALFEYIQERISDLLRLETIIQLRARLFDHVLGLSIDYYETHRAGEIVEKVTESIYTFGIWLQETAQAVLLRILTIIFSCVVILLINPLAGAIVTITVILRLLIAMKKKQVSRPWRMEARKFHERISGVITESIQNLTTLRSFGGEKRAVTKYEELADGVREVRLKQHRIEWRYNSVAIGMEGVGIVLTVAAIAYSVVAGSASAGDVFLVTLYMQQAIINLRGLATYIDMTGELITSCDRLLELLHTQPTVRDTVEATGLRTLNTIEFRDVSFNYPGHDQKVLDNVSFELRSGKMLALVGPSGTGKTTIVKLLLRLYEPTSGQILINGKDIASFKAEALREHIGTVMQDVALFNESFADNVRIAKLKASQNEVETAVKLAHATEFVDRLPDGYETIVGERGIKLSGGQKQRVAIARAILKEPNLVILDEATSALDSTSEREVQKGLNSLLKGRMSVVIAHRLSTIRHADEILVIENGKIEESGNHEQLIKADGLYAKLYKLQSEKLLA